MRYWWVNQNQTYRHEVPGNYLWSPKRKANGHRNAFYEFMREVAPGDLVFSFCDTKIRAVGIAKSFAYEAPKPEEFGSAGRNWDAIGWRVDVRFSQIAQEFRPELHPDLALALAGLISAEVLALAQQETIADADSRTPTPEIVLWEEHLRRSIEEDLSIPDTDRDALVIARRGQGLFRERVQAIEYCCRVTRVDRQEHLRASHCKPWRDSNHEERLNGENGLLLTPSIDHLFDRGFISFEKDGRLLVSPVAHKASLQRMGVSTAENVNVGGFSSGQGHFLEFHRDSVFLRSHVSR